MKKLRQNKGITLIALIITIIVMLILVGVTINVALNGNLFGKAETAKTETNKEVEKEQLMAAVISAYDAKTGAISKQTLERELGTGWQVTGTDGGPYTCTSPKGNKFTVDENGKITDGDDTNGGIDFEKVKQDVIADPDKYLAKAREIGQNTDLITDIGIGTDGGVVNLGLWVYSTSTGSGEPEAKLGSDGSFSLGYIGDYNSDGTIEGSVPQYIYSEGTIFTVTSMAWTFCNSTELKIVPQIPITVNDVYYIFYGCTSLTTACEIPANLEYASGMFAGCSNLEGTIIINSETIISLSNMLFGVGSAEKPIVLKGTGTNREILEAIKATGNSDYITIEE